MGRASKATAERHHEELIEAAARLFRERDLAAVSVPDVMSSIGLTRGGFYKHFESKDALLTAAIDEVFNQHLSRIRDIAARHGDDPAAIRSAFADFVLSPEHRADPGSGCPGAMASGIARCDPDGAPRAAYSNGIQTVVRELMDRTRGSGEDADAARDQLLTDLATMTGAILLARATAGDSISDDFLTAVRRRLGAADPVE